MKAVTPEKSWFNGLLLDTAASFSPSHSLSHFLRSRLCFSASLILSKRRLSHCRSSSQEINRAASDNLELHFHKQHAAFANNSVQWEPFSDEMLELISCSVPTCCCVIGRLIEQTVNAWDCWGWINNLSPLCNRILQRCYHANRHQHLPLYTHIKRQRCLSGCYYNVISVII